MLEPPQIVETTEQLSAVIRLTIPREEIRHVMGPGITELMGVVSKQCIGPTGAWFSHHLRFDPDVFDFEIGVPVSAPVTPEGRVVGSWLPAATVLRATYQGPYEGLGDAWAEFDAWVKAQGFELIGNAWEIYQSGPETGLDPSTYRTEINRPIKV